MVTDFSDHLRITAYCCISKAVTYFSEKYQKLPFKLTLRVWSDGCATQFGSCYEFSLILCYDRLLNMSWFYNERQHLKGPMDGLGGTEKNVISKDSKSESAQSTHRKSLQVRK